MFLEGPKNRRSSKNIGVVLIETVVAIVMSAVVANTLLPAATDAMRTAKLSSSATALYADLNTGRITAINHNSTVVVCSVKDPFGQNLRCNHDAPQWHQGWVIFLRSNTPRGIEIDPASIIVRHTALPLGVQAVETSHRDEVTFLPDGTAKIDASFDFSMPESRRPLPLRRLKVDRRGHLSLSVTQPAST